MTKLRNCSRCRQPREATLFSADNRVFKTCFFCRSRGNSVIPDLDPKAAKAAAKAAVEEAARQGRLNSDFQQLRPTDDFDVSEGNDGRRDPAADREKKQEFSKSDGDFLKLLRESGGDPTKMPKLEAEKNAYYLAIKSEQERRFRNRGIARYEAVRASNEALELRNMMSLAKEYFHDKCRPSGYAKKTLRNDQRQANIILLSDLHFGADMFIRDNPQAYGAEHESRLFGHVVQQVSNYKTRHRDNTKLIVCANGDNIEGMLGHDARDGSPLTEQKGACLHYFQSAIQQWSRDYPHVEVHWQPGNHGRDKMRHPGRATSSKWDGHEWWLGYCLSQICAGLKNVTFSVPFRAVSTIDVFGKKILMTHGDTEIKLGDPDSKANENMRSLATYQAVAWETQNLKYDLALFGHFHKFRMYPWMPLKAIFNGCLIPPNGHARSSGYIGERRVQTLFHSVPGHVMGHIFPIELETKHENDADLNKVITPFRFAGGPSWQA